MPTSTPTAKSPADKFLSLLPYIALFALMVPVAYMAWFLHLDQSISVKTGDWGTFGDFVGGVLNPLAAFCALIMLTLSVTIQKDELSKVTDAHEKTVIHHQSMKVIEDCKNYLAVIQTEIENELSKSYKFNWLSQEDQSGSRQFIESEGNLQEILFELNTDYIDDMDDKSRLKFISEYQSQLENIRESLKMAAGALRVWEELHGEDFCFSVMRYKKMFSDLADELYQAHLIPGGIHSYLKSIKKYSPTTSP